MSLLSRHVDSVIVVDTPTYRSKLKYGAQLHNQGKPPQTEGMGIFREARRIIEHREANPDFKVFVIDGVNVSADSLLRLIPSGTAEHNYVGWKSRVESGPQSSDGAAEPPSLPKHPGSTTASASAPTTNTPIKQWLESVHPSLATYADPLAAYGYEDTAMLMDAGEADLTEAFDDASVNMKKPHRKKFLTAFAALSVNSKQ